MLAVAGVAVAVVALSGDDEPDVARVPTVVGLVRTTAESRIRAAGFVAEVELRSGGGRLVLLQQPEPGALLSRGSRVGITLGRRTATP